MKRGSGLARRTPLVARTGLARASGLNVKSAAAPGAGSARRKSASRDTGPSARARRIVIARFDGRCAATGRLIQPGVPYSIQHILARGVGGTNSLDNLVLLYGSATMPPDAPHPRCERRDPAMRERGFWRKSTDPVRPLVLWDARAVWLQADGSYVTEQGAA